MRGEVGGSGVGLYGERVGGLNVVLNDAEVGGV